MKKETRRSIPIALSLLLALAFIIPGSTTASATGPGGWDHLGDGDALDKLGGAVYVVNSEKPGVLLAGGTFLNAGGHAEADHLAQWNGSDWIPVGSPALTGDVNSIAVDGDRIFVGGVFQDAGGNANADFLAVWDGTNWAPMCTATGPAFGGNVHALQIIGSTLYVGGSFQNGAGLPAADYLLACDLTTGASRSTVPNDHDISSSVLTMDADSNGNLYVGGGFNDLARNPNADNVAYMDTAGGWHSMGTGAADGDPAANGFVRSLTANGTDVYVSTDATNIAGIAQADHVAKWNGSSWSAMGSNTDGTNGWFSTTTYIYAMTTSGSLVFASGSFQDANGDPLADNVAYFDGTAWRNVGSNGAGNGPWIGNGTTLTVSDGQLYAGGNFTSAGGDRLAWGLASFALLRPKARIGLIARSTFPGTPTTGHGESKTISVRRGHAGTFFVDFENVGLTNGAFTIVGTGRARGFAVTYFSGTTNVTATVRAGTFSTGTLRPSDHLTLKMVVKLSARSARIGSFVTKAKSGPGIEADAVKAVVKAK